MSRLPVGLIDRIRGKALPWRKRSGLARLRRLKKRQGKRQGRTLRSSREKKATAARPGPEARKRHRAQPGSEQASGAKRGRKAANEGDAVACDPAAMRSKLQLRIEEDPLGDCPPPISSFEGLKWLPSYVFNNLQRHGMKAPMPIQAQALPLVVAGRDVIGLAQTGSGKTLAFLLPVALRAAERQGDCKDPFVLVLAPTRELAVQISDESEKVFGCPESHRGAAAVRTACVYGGGDKWHQRQKLKRGVDVLVATPGRLLDFVESKDVLLKQVSYFVLDEADRMLDMGFNEDVTTLAAQTRKDRQVLFFSATWGTDVQKLAQGLCRKGSKPIRISYGQGERSTDAEAAAHQAREGIAQQVVVVDHKGEDHWERQEEEKQGILNKHLQDVLEASPDHKVLVFVSQKHLADKVSGQLSGLGFKADSMHGGKSQEYRLWVLDQFRKGELRLLVCTDVLGRGIDIPSVTHVVIHEMGEIEDYIHRIGRTARGRHGSGHALVFFEYWEGSPRLAADLIGVLEASKQKVPDALRRIADEVAAGKRKVRSDSSKW